jgi:hypothetical protein
MNYNDIIFFSCMDNNVNQIKRIFERYNENADEIDVLFSDYQLFKIAISNNNFEICKALLSFFENKQNPSEEQKEKLKETLEEITSFSDISKEMKEVLKNYVPYEENYMEGAFADCFQGCSGQVYYEAPEENHIITKLAGETLE